MLLIVAHSKLSPHHDEDHSKRLKVIECNKSQTNPIKQTYGITSLLFTLVKLNLSGLKG